MLRRLGIVYVQELVVTALAAVPALAVAPLTVEETGGLHVCEGSALDVTANKTDPTSAFLTTTGEVCGAGSTATVLLTATAEVTTGCINPGSKNQQPKERQTTTTTATGSQEIPTRAGRA